MTKPSIKTTRHFAGSYVFEAILKIDGEFKTVGGTIEKNEDAGTWVYAIHFDKYSKNYGEAETYGSAKDYILQEWAKKPGLGFCCV